MKNIFSILIALVLCVSAVSCSDDKEQTTVPELEVNYANLAGSWKLSTWNNSATDNGTYVYITFDRKDKTFVMYQNTDSFGSRKRTGSYAIYTEPAIGAIIRGVYDYSLGDWGHRYIISSLTAEQMVWVAKDDVTDISVYTRSTVPDEVLTASAE